ncbi:hypothetical protein TGAM01_v208424 [Trichoderma gamsii]|uniref:Secreted protein n=1 Tax=Trichoderma gamsii TaxID=398673 RepID=A0A2P4ZEN6_9HYPO|nr:hypothetical protein TGAM01_v208424 [Trichoderma gamsii]PON22738.1 hypothetical protein TGAM01_v208424 [Trichoderma gamsii]
MQVILGIFTTTIILIHAGHSADPQHSRPWDVLIHGRWYIPLATDIHTSPCTSEVVSYKKRKKGPSHANAECEMSTKNNNPKMVSRLSGFPASRSRFPP